MITLFVEENNTLTQNFYNNLIASLQFHRLTCSCGHSGCLSILGYYKRSIRTNEGKQPLHICRVKCSECNRTHAILPSSIVPYSQISLADQVTVIEAYESDKPTASELEDLSSVEPSNLRYIIRMYKAHWKERLLSASISIASVPELIKSCFLHYNRQFMQIMY